MIRIILCICLLACGVPGQILAGKYNRSLDIGMSAPAWKQLPGVDGKQHSLADLDKRDVVVVVFTCNSCLYAVDYEDRIVEFGKRCTEASKIALVAINVNKLDEDRLPAMRERARAKSFNFPYLFDESQQIAKDYGATRTPEFFVLNKQRKIVYMGAMDDSPADAKQVKKYLLDEAVEAALRGDQPKESETIAIGCNIRFERTRRRRSPAGGLVPNPRP